MYTCLFATMWELHNIENVLENECDIVEEKVAKVKTMLLDFTDVLCETLAHSTNLLIVKEVFCNLCLFCNMCPFHFLFCFFILTYFLGLHIYVCFTCHML